MVRRAECCCKRMSISVTGDPVINAVCHCDDCKRRTGSAFGWSVYFREDQIVERRGETAAYRVAVNEPQVRWFCPHCGSTLYWQTGNIPGLTGIAGGSFAAAPVPEPRLSVSTAQACPWVRLPESWNRR